MQFVCFKELSENTKYNINLKERNSRENILCKGKENRWRYNRKKFKDIRTGVGEKTWFRESDCTKLYILKWIGHTPWEDE